MEDVIDELYRGELHPARDLADNTPHGTAGEIFHADAFTEGFRLGAQFILAIFTA